jgi:hypothetical protein
MYIRVRKLQKIMDYSVKTYEELVREEDTLNDEYENLSDECAKNGLKYNEFKEKATPIRQKIYFVSKYKRLKQPPTLEYNKEWNGNLYTIEQFIEMSESGGFMDYDGFGHFIKTVDGKKYAIVDIYFSIDEDDVSYKGESIGSIFYVCNRLDLREIVWFNK